MPWEYLKSLASVPPISLSPALRALAARCTAIVSPVEDYKHLRPASGDALPAANMVGPPRAYKGDCMWSR